MTFNPFRFALGKAIRETPVVGAPFQGIRHIRAGFHEQRAHALVRQAQAADAGNTSAVHTNEYWHNLGRADARFRGSAELRKRHGAVVDSDYFQALGERASEAGIKWNLRVQMDPSDQASYVAGLWKEYAQMAKTASRVELAADILRGVVVAPVLLGATGAPVYFLFGEKLGIRDPEPTTTGTRGLWE